MVILMLILTVANARYNSTVTSNIFRAASLLNRSKNGATKWHNVINCSSVCKIGRICSFNNLKLLKTSLIIKTFICWRVFLFFKNLNFKRHRMMKRSNIARLPKNFELNADERNLKHAFEDRNNFAFIQYIF